MLAKWMSLLRVSGWNTPTKEMIYATTALDTEYEAPIIFENEVIQRVSRKAGFKVLGTIITFDCQDDIELERRFSAAWGFFPSFLPFCYVGAFRLKGVLLFLLGLFTQLSFGVLVHGT